MQIGMIGLDRVGNIPKTSGREEMKSTAEEGYLYCGSPGSGHFVKMVHNGIEYGLMQAYAEGRWTIAAALEEGVSAEVLSAALDTRFRSRQEHTFAEKILSAMRKGFGGHIERHQAVKMKPGL